MNQFDEIIQRLERAWQGGRCGTSPRAFSQPRILRCARRWDGSGRVLNADSAEELEELRQDGEPPCDG